MEQFEKSITAQDEVIANCFKNDDVSLACFENNGVSRNKNAYKLLKEAMDCKSGDYACHEEIIFKHISVVTNALDNAITAYVNLQTAKKEVTSMIYYWNYRNNARHGELRRAMSRFF